MSTEHKYKLGILGIGNMGSIFLKSVVENGIVPAKEIAIYDIIKKNTEKFKKSLSVIVTNDEIELFIDSEFFFIAVKPQFLPEIIDKIISQVKKMENFQKIIKSKTIISIAAGIPIDFYTKKLGDEISIVRIMPNILASVNEAASALTPNINVTAEQLDFVTTIFERIGLAVQVKEHLMDVVTGMSGSGPAFIAILVEAMVDGAVKMGMPRDVAYKLAAQTVKGTGEMLLKTELHPAIMKDMVSSPGGVTIVGIHELEKRGFRNTVINAVEAATLRSKELNSKK